MRRRCTRKHTPIVSEKQRGLFGYWRGNPSARPASITAEEVSAHLSESKGKELPKRSRRRRRKRG